MRERLQSLDQISQYVGMYFSKEYVMKNILHFSDEDIASMDKQIASEPQMDTPDDE